MVGIGMEQASGRDGIVAGKERGRVMRGGSTPPAFPSFPLTPVPCRLAGNPTGVSIYYVLFFPLRVLGQRRLPPIQDTREGAAHIGSQ